MLKSKSINVRSVFYFYAALAIVAVIWILVSSIECTLFGTKGFLIAILLGFLIFVFSLHISIRYPWAQDLEKVFADLLTPLPLLQIFLIAAFSSIGEELFFRGAVQNQFGIIIASILFGLVHLPIDKKMVPWTLMAMAMGFVLGGLYMYSGNLLAPITLHFLINFLNIWAINQKFLTFDE